jgi:hypothetical protein
MIELLHGIDQIPHASFRGHIPFAHLDKLREAKHVDKGDDPFLVVW